MEYKRLDLKNGATLDENHLKHLEDGIIKEHSSYVSKNISPKVVESGDTV